MATTVELEKIGKLIREQDNRITDQPMFLVQQKVRDYGYDGNHSSDGYTWIDPDNDHCEATDQQAKRLDKLYGRGRGSWERVYYKERWEFVTACFTEQGCKDYIALDGHNLNEPRIYAEGSYRNEEYRTVRKYLMELGTICTWTKNGDGSWRAGCNGMGYVVRGDYPASSGLLECKECGKRIVTEN